MNCHKEFEEGTSGSSVGHRDKSKFCLTRLVFESLYFIWDILKEWLSVSQSAAGDSGGAEGPGPAAHQ